ncbi:MAG: rhomboid family intramembrane serine protease [Anaerolineales bacterium]|nr:rhomboid family intramembrane serine protease [Anaerolineales bacterium]
MNYSENPETPNLAPAAAPSGRVAVRLPQNAPYVTYAILALTILVFLGQLGTEAIFGADLLAYFGAKINEAIAAGQFWRLFTPMLLHGSILHIGFNMYALYLFGPRLERYFGPWRFLALYILSGFGGNVFSMLFTEAFSLGSSTAIFGLISAQGVFLYQNREVFGSENTRQAISSIVMVAGINLVIGLSPGIDNWGHIGGLIGGLIFTWLGGPLLGIGGSYPGYQMVDQRSTQEVIQAGLAVAGFFLILTIGSLFLAR